MLLEEMDCSNCGEGTGSWFEPSGAPQYHFFYCEHCKEEIEDSEED
jgi:hypothetical protein